MDGTERLDAVPVTESETPPALSDAIDRLLAHPELISMVASAIGMGQTASPPPAEAQTAEAQTAEAQAADAVSLPAPSESTSLPTGGIRPDAMASLSPLLGMLSGKGAKGKKSAAEDSRACLLRALKPYVSRGRCEAIDAIIQISRLSELLKNMS